MLARWTTSWHHSVWAQQGGMLIWRTPSQTGCMPSTMTAPHCSTSSISGDPLHTLCCATGHLHPHHCTDLSKSTRNHRLQASQRNFGCKEGMHAPMDQSCQGADLLPFRACTVCRAAVAMGLQEVIEQQHEKSRQLFAGPVLSQLTMNCACPGTPSSPCDAQIHYHAP